MIEAGRSSIPHDVLGMDGVVVALDVARRGRPVGVGPPLEYHAR